MDEKKVEIKVRVDDDTTVLLTLKEEMDAGELAMMLDKARGIAKTSIRGNIKRAFGEKKFQRVVFDDKTAKEFIRDIEKAGKEGRAEVERKYGIREGTGYQKYKYLRDVKKIG